MRAHLPRAIGGIVPLFTALFVGSGVVSSQAPPAQTAGSRGPAEHPALRALGWRGIGPANPGGRVTVVSGIPDKPEVFYVAGAAGGVEQKKLLRVETDRRGQVPTVDLQSQLDAGLQLRDLSNRINQLIQQADNLISELASAAARNDAGAARARTLLDQARAIRFRMGRLPGEQGYRIQGRLREDIQSLLGSATAVPGPLTAGEKIRLGEVKVELDQISAEWQTFLTTVKGP